MKQKLQINYKKIGTNYTHSTRKEHFVKRRHSRDIWKGFKWALGVLQTNSKCEGCSPLVKNFSRLLCTKFFLLMAFQGKWSPSVSARWVRWRLPQPWGFSLSRISLMHKVRRQKCALQLKENVEFFSRRKRRIKTRFFLIHDVTSGVAPKNMGIPSQALKDHRYNHTKVSSLLKKGQLNRSKAPEDVKFEVFPFFFCLENLTTPTPTTPTPWKTHWPICRVNLYEICFEIQTWRRNPEYRQPRISCSVCLRLCHLSQDMH